MWDLAVFDEKRFWRGAGGLGWAQGLPRPARFCPGWAHFSPGSRIFARGGCTIPRAGALCHGLAPLCPRVGTAPPRAGRFLPRVTSSRKFVYVPGSGTNYQNSSSPGDYWVPRVGFFPKERNILGPPPICRWRRKTWSWSPAFRVSCPGWSIFFPSWEWLLARAVLLVAPGGLFLKLAPVFPGPRGSCLALAWRPRAPWRYG